MRNEVYFCLISTGGAQRDLLQYCDTMDLELVYYRQLKEGHIPGYREVKIRGLNAANKVHSFLWGKQSGYLFQFVVENPYTLVTKKPPKEGYAIIGGSVIFHRSEARVHSMPIT